MSDTTRNLYTDAIRRLDRAAEHARIDEEAVESLKHHKAVVEVAVPVRMDDGSRRVFTGYRVRHDDTRGPSKGGIRFHPDVTADECRALSFWMTFKTAASGLPFGGGKGGIAVRAKELSRTELERLSRSYIRQIADFIGPDRDVPAPDVYTNDIIMGWMADEYAIITRRQSPAVITGKPVSLGGTLGRRGATGRGAHVCTRQLARRMNWQPEQTTVAIQGFGNAGRSLARRLHEDGYRVVAVSDSKGGVYCEQGLDIPAVIEHKQATRRVDTGYDDASVCDKDNVDRISNEELLQLQVDLLVPAALAGAITADNAASVQARAILEIANGPVSSEADPVLEDKGVVVVPDILASAGGVVVSYFEWVQNRQGDYWSAEQVDQRLERVMTREFDATDQLAQERGLDLRIAAYVHALDRLGQALQAQGTQSYFNQQTG